MSKKLKSVYGFKHYLKADYLVACSDAVVATDNSISLIRVIDQLSAFALPLTLSRFFIVAQFWRNVEVSVADFVSAKLEHKIVIVNPLGRETELSIGSNSIDEKNPWFTSRSITDMAGRLNLGHEGIYTLKILGRTANSDFEELLEKKIPVVLLKGVPGIYTVDFSADPEWAKSEKRGSGYVFLLPDGGVQGSDSGYSYSGRYSVGKDDAIQAELLIRKSDPNAISIFGPAEEFGLDLEGKLQSGAMALTGHRKDDPSQKIALVLNRCTALSPPLHTAK